MFLDWIGFSFLCVCGTVVLKCFFLKWRSLSLLCVSATSTVVTEPFFSRHSEVSVSSICFLLSFAAEETDCVTLRALSSSVVHLVVLQSKSVAVVFNAKLPFTLVASLWSF